MLNLVVCVKQVPMVSELTWNAKTGTLKRELAQGMMDPASRRALEAALRIKEGQPAHICVLTMGPPMAEEILHQAKALGADEGVLLTDRRMAGADTFLTSQILARCIRLRAADVDLVLCGCQTSDSETAQVAPQLADALGIPAITYAEKITVAKGCARVERHVDDFYEVLEMDLPGLISVDLTAYTPRYLALDGVEQAFASPAVSRVDAAQLGFDDSFHALKNSPTRIIEVYSPASCKKSHRLKGAVKKVVDQLFDEYGKVIGGAMGKDLKTHSHGEQGE